MSRSKIALLIAAGVIVVVGPIVYVYLFGFQTVDAVEAHWIGHKDPLVSQVPVSLPDTSVSSIAHKKVSYFGYEVELPWDDVDPNQAKDFGTVHVTYFRSGNLFWFSAFPPRNFIDEVIKDSDMDADTFCRAYGLESTPSDYDFSRRMLEVTPDTISPFAGEHEDSTNSALLVLKAIAMPKTHSGIFEIQSGELRGFQFASASGKPNVIVDDLYGEDGGVEFWFGQHKQSSVPAITQPEINRVLQSIHKISAPPTAPATQPGPARSRKVD